MNRNSLSAIGKIILGLVGILLMIQLLIIMFKLIPTSNAVSFAYPVPLVTERSTDSPEYICGQWFSFRNGMSEDQQKVLEFGYQNCINARKTPLSVISTKDFTLSTPVSGYSSPFFSRSSGLGTITETNFSPLNSRYKIWNSWHGLIGDREYTAFAGGHQTESQASVFDDWLWRGVLIVEVYDEKGNILKESGGEFLIPENIGSVRIVDSTDAVLTLITINGGIIYFNLLSQKFYTNEQEPEIIRNFEEGELIENGDLPLFAKDYDVVNQFRAFDQEKFSQKYLAGRAISDLKQGVFLALQDFTGDESQIEAIIFTPRLKDGALRVVACEDGKLVLVSESGLIYIYDLFARNFTLVPEGDSIDFSPVTLSTDNDGETSVTNTPTPRPTRTALPTNIPYP